MKMCEYKVVEFVSRGMKGRLIKPLDIEKKLNELGQLGWELVTSFSINAGYGSTRKVIYTLKKES